MILHTEYSDKRPCDQEKLTAKKRQAPVAIKIHIMRQTIFRFSFPDNHHYHRCDPLLSDLRVHVGPCAAKTSVGVQAEALTLAL